MDDDTLNSLRYTFQRILVPCVVIIGVLGNFVSVIVLTRYVEFFFVVFVFVFKLTMKKKNVSNYFIGFLGG